MEFSNRDNNQTPPICCSPLRSQSGQGTIEYILILVVAVFIILGLLYQLNSAFKVWANNYFGEYLTCLLETGELPTIGGAPGDSEICNQLFKPFNLADGRRLKEAGGAAEEKAPAGTGGGAREKSSGGGGGGGPSRGGGGGNRGFAKSSSGVPTRQGRKIAANGGSTGNMSANDYGGGYSYYQRPQASRPKTKLNNRFAFEDQRDKDTKRKVASSAKKDERDQGIRGAIKMKPRSLKKDAQETTSNEFTIGNFLRILLLIAIVIALVVFLGGQMLQISKSMD